MKVTTDSCFFGAWAAAELQRFVKDHPINSPVKVLDIGTGTGLLSLMVSQKNDVLIDTVEIDPAAAAQAAENVSRSPWKNKIRVIKEDISIFKASERYNCVICNPPFYEKEIISDDMQKNIAHHSALLTITQVLQNIAFHLMPDGIFFLMYPAKRQSELNELLHQQSLFPHKVLLLQQSIHHEPFRVIVMGGKTAISDPDYSEVAICDHEQKYTAEFSSLLRDYYFYL